ncbi:MAG: heparinase II/III family protein [Clostridia bacterium]|nr:heparinase II/III family protein [Clostridia bacterium]
MFNRFLKQHSFSEYKFRSDIFPPVENRDFWDAFQNEDCVKAAEKELGYAWPVIKATDFMEFKKSGNRKIMENIHFDRRNHLTLFALAELKENRGRFLPQIVNGLFALCEESYWGVSAHWLRGVKNIPTPKEPYIDLFAAETAEHVAVITKLLHAPLTEFCPEILDRVEYELETRIKTPYLTHFDYWWFGYNKTPNNWNPWILSNVLTVFLLTETNERMLHRALEKMFKEIQLYYNALPSDGGCDEGPGYWAVAGVSLFEFVYELKQATDGALNLFDDEKLGRIAAYMKKVHIVSGCFVNVADAHHTTEKTGEMVLLYGFARETKQEDLMNFSVAVYMEKASKSSVLRHTVRTMRRLIYCSEFLKEMERFPITLPLHGALECLPDTQLAVLRKGDMVLSAKGGFNNESHNHNDVGSITMYDGTTPVLIDVGIGVYTRFTFSKERYTVIPWVKSQNHNIPMINGTEQPYGAGFRADCFEAEEGKITISFAGAYPAEAGISKLTRTLALTERGMSCTDSFTFTDEKAQKVTEVLMSILPVRIEDGAAILGERYCVRTSHGTVRAEFLPFEDVNLEADWKANGVTRILCSVEGAESVTVTVEKLK